MAPLSSPARPHPSQSFRPPFLQLGGLHASGHGSNAGASAPTASPSSTPPLPSPCSAPMDRKRRKGRPTATDGHGITLCPVRPAQLVRHLYQVKSPYGTPLSSLISTSIESNLIQSNPQQTMASNGSDVVMMYGTRRCWSRPSSPSQRLSLSR
jgi:hypothetical protein